VYSGMWIPTFRGEILPQSSGRKEALKKAVCSSETLVIAYMTTRYPEPDDRNMNLHRHENLRSDI
jgi:hypothetical protein